MKKAVLLLTLVGALAFGGSVAAETQEVTDDGWTVIDSRKNPPETVTESPDLPDGYGTWRNPNLKLGPTGQIYLEVNGNTLSPDVEPFLDANDRTMVPVRIIMEELASDVAWDGSDGQGRVDITHKGKVIKLWIGRKTAQVDGKELPLDTSPCLKNNRTMVPVRFVAEALGADVDWGSNTVFISFSEI